jgi:hypothetical protein
MTSEAETSIHEFVDREYQYGFVSRQMSPRSASCSARATLLFSRSAHGLSTPRSVLRHSRATSHAENVDLRNVLRSKRS